MQHRIRSAGILIENNSILLLHVQDESGEYWIPPGGGFEATDLTTKECLRREFFEEAGLAVKVGELICVREFLETRLNRYNAEFFYHIVEFDGAPHLSNLVGLNDADFIQGIEWVAIDEVKHLRTYPADMTHLIQLVRSQQFSVHLGSYIQGEQDHINQFS
ncbi:NUDIX domain-containing protein [Vibrio sinensis]|uniref:NUDIX domain-containing protein n=1 Tax=Vibrio sinensis TaxID=2302434 RepID=A0A3A6QK65_9VIBR|nr:NUDIX domain-containing protein [Vibrio sinensis]RJX72903.1 NUDIX domain-containing protein [Vibrio sinensis]